MKTDPRPEPLGLRNWSVGTVRAAGVEPFKGWCWSGAGCAPSLVKQEAACGGRQESPARVPGVGRPAGGRVFSPSMRQFQQFEGPRRAVPAAAMVTGPGMAGAEGQVPPPPGPGPRQARTVRSRRSSDRKRLVVASRVTHGEPGSSGSRKATPSLIWRPFGPHQGRGSRTLARHCSPPGNPAGPTKRHARRCDRPGAKGGVTRGRRREHRRLSADERGC